MPKARRAHISLETTEPTTFGHGWISGVLSVVLGVLGLGAVLCFHFPSYLTFPELRGAYPIPLVRAALHLVLVSAFVLGSVSVCLRYNKALGLTGVGLSVVAALLGGSRVPLDGELIKGPYLGLDWFLLNLILTSAAFIPLERAFALRPEQPIFRKGWRTDLAYFGTATLAVQLTTLLTMKPAMVLFDWAKSPAIAGRIASLPFLVQVFGILVISDVSQYWIHRAFHQVPFLWRFHAIHHSAEHMDWIAGSRLHLVDVAVTRGLVYVPIYLLGFSEAALFTYVIWVAVQSTVIHANVHWTFGPVRHVLATPAFHHWHHGAEPKATDKNFAVHLPVLDRIFGTYYCPDRWPKRYGLAHGRRVPDGFMAQFLHPLRPGSR